MAREAGSGGHEDRRAPRRPRPRGKALASGAGTLLGALILVACSAETRHRVLTFLFDGVPAPGEVEAAPPTLDQLLPAEPARAATRFRPDPPLRATRFFASVHAPYAESRCTECHTLDQMATPLPLDQALCLRCHADAVRWDHGPVALGLCQLCHDPHLAEQPHLARMPQPALCTGCHRAATLMTDIPEHRGREESLCTDCHDPHTGSAVGVR